VPPVRATTCAIALLCAAGALQPAAAEPPTRFVCPREISASPIWIDDVAGLQVHLAVLHQDARGQLIHDGRSYPVHTHLAERLEEDFGEFAPLALRQVHRALLEVECPLRSLLQQQALYEALAHVQRHLPYRVRPNVLLEMNTELWVHRLARHFFRRSGHVLVITSGTRTPEQQAAAMYGKLARGGRYRTLYRKRELAEEIRQVYLAARRKRQRRREIVEAMTRKIEEQIQNGFYVSAHLKRVAVDVRSYSMTRRVKRTFRRAMESFEGTRLIKEERRPPHFHMEVPGEPAVRRMQCPHLDLSDGLESTD
jgi:hypothetical protein